MNPDVSIIVPVYNVEQYVSRCIDSILKQSLTNIEIILVNDGSTDASGSICDNYANLDNRIKIIHKKNGGLSDARNAGLDIARGKYIAFVDSDDYIHKDMYNILLNVMTENNCDVAESGYKEVFDKDDINDDDQYSGQKRIYNKQDAVISTIMDHNCRNYVWNKLYKRELWDDIRFPFGKIFEDVSTTYLVIDRCSKIVKIDMALYYYYQRPDSIVNSKFSIRNLDYCYALEDMMVFIEKKYADFAPITVIKYFFANLKYLQELLVNRNTIDNSDVHIKYILERLNNKTYIKYLDADIGLLCKQVFVDNYHSFLKQKTTIKIRIFLLRRSTWLLYLFNNSIKLVKSVRG